MLIDATSQEGNAYSIMGYVRKLLEKTGRIDEWPQIREQMTSGDYDNLCNIAEKVTHSSIKITNRP